MICGCQILCFCRWNCSQLGSVRSAATSVRSAARHRYVKSCRCIRLWSCLVWLSVFRVPLCLRSSRCCVYINSVLFKFFFLPFSKLSPVGLAVSVGPSVLYSNDLPVTHGRMTYNVSSWALNPTITIPYRCLSLSLWCHAPNVCWLKLWVGYLISYFHWFHNPRRMRWRDIVRWGRGYLLPPSIGKLQFF